MQFTKRLRDPIKRGEITTSIVDLLKIANHGAGENVYLIRFR